MKVSQISEYLQGILNCGIKNIKYEISKFTIMEVLNLIIDSEVSLEIVKLEMVMIQFKITNNYKSYHLSCEARTFKCDDIECKQIILQNKLSKYETRIFILMKLGCFSAIRL